MKSNPIQFAVVREDPDVEIALVERHALKSALLIASGGCTALSMRAATDADIHLVDMNASQLELVRRKLAALNGGRSSRFNVDDPDPSGLNACGNFESLFRSLRLFLEDLVFEAGAAHAFFNESNPERRASTLASWTRNPFWRAAFAMHFDDGLLEAMFGPAAIQHAEPGSYVGYFQRVLEDGLRRPDAPSNYFLHHIFVGHYLPAALPTYLRRPLRSAEDFPECEGTLADMHDLAQFDLISLSNITDWMNSDELRDLARTLGDASPGTVAVFRQLNSNTDLDSLLGSAWEPLPRDARELHGSDRSLFYDRLRVYRRRP